MPIGLPLYLWICTIDVVDEQLAIVAEGVGAERQRLEGLLIHEVKPSPSEYRNVAATWTRSGSPNFSPALKVLSNTARVSRFRIFRRTSVWPPRAVGLETSTSRQTYGAFSNSKNVFRLISMASIRLGTSRVYRSRVGRCVQAVDLAL